MKVPPENIINAVGKAKDSASGVNKASKDDKGGFSEILKNSINKTNELQKEASNAVNMLASGEKIDIHNAMIAVEKADVSFRLMMEVRNKIVEAYHEITRMQV
jgi:flagellar hook-basal body complex protein FliE